MEFLLILIYVINWIWVALNENIIYRESLAAKMNVKLIIILSTSITILFIGSKLIEIKVIDIIFTHLTIMFITGVLQTQVIKKYKSHFLKKSITFTSFIYLLTVIVYASQKV